MPRSDRERLIETNDALHKIVKSLRKIQRNLDRIDVDMTLENVVDQMRDGTISLMIREMTKARDYTRDRVRELVLEEPEEPA